MEVSARFCPRSVFVAGEQVHCLITFKNKGSPEGPPVCLAWASVQLQCEYVTTESLSGATLMMSQKSSLAPMQRTEPSSSTSLDSQGMMSRNVSRTCLRPVDWLEGTQIMASKPKLLFCELHLAPGESKNFAYEDFLPRDVPPSYRGKNIKFCHNILIGSQLLVNSNVEVLKVPFRVLTSPPSCSMMPLDKDHELPIANPFLPSSLNDSAEEALLRPEIAFPAQKSSNSPSVYDINVPAGHIAKFHIPKKNFKLGEVIMGCLRFPDQSEVKCVQYSVSLISEEELFKTDKSSGEKISSQKTRTKVAKSHDFTFGYEESSFSLEVPLHVTPTFDAAICTHQWQLHFEFVIFGNSLKDAMVIQDDDFSEWNAPQRINVQTLEWDLPVHVFTSDPAQVECAKPGKAHTNQQPFSLLMSVPN